MAVALQHVSKGEKSKVTAHEPCIRVWRIRQEKHESRQSLYVARSGAHRDDRLWDHETIESGGKVEPG